MVCYLISFKFEMNGIKIVDKIDIANKFNQYFTNIGPDLATNISRSSEKVIYDQTYSYFQNNVIFILVNMGLNRGTLLNMQLWN